MNPSDFAWWAWILIGVGAGLVWMVSGLLLTDAENKGLGWLCWIFAVLSGVTSAICFVIGIIRFVKWVWSS